jgi:hypothetical protein
MYFQEIQILESGDGFTPFFSRSLIISMSFVIIKLYITIPFFIIVNYLSITSGTLEIIFLMKFHR